jgi:hypothetical protein
VDRELVELHRQDQELLLVDLTVVVTDFGLVIQLTKAMPHQAVAVELISVLVVPHLQTESLSLEVAVVKVVALAVMVNSQLVVTVNQHLLDNHSLLKADLVEHNLLAEQAVEHQVLVTVLLVTLAHLV